MFFFWVWLGTHTFYTQAEAVQLLFPSHDRVQPIWQSWDEVPATVRQHIRDEPAIKDARLVGEFQCLQVFRGTESLGWAILTEEWGKHEAMTLMVSITPNLQVQGTLLMVFRENRGNGVKHPKFLKQFEGKTSADPIEVDIDLVHVSGSTISSRAMALGVRKSLFLIHYLTHVDAP